MLIVAAALMAFLGIAHSILGEVYIVRPLYRQPELPRLRGAEFPLATVRFAWHVTSMLALVVAGVLFQVAIGASMDAVAIWIGSSLIATGLLPLLYTRGRHPGWIVFFVVGGACLLWAAF